MSLLIKIRTVVILSRFFYQFDRNCRKLSNFGRCIRQSNLLRSNCRQKQLLFMIKETDKMEEENNNFDSSVPEVEEIAREAASQGSKNEKTNEKANNLKELADNASVVSYGFIGDLKSKGHNSLGDLVFRDTMTMICAANLASESIGKDRFTEYLEKGFYATGRLLVYLNFAGTLAVNENVREALIDSVTGVHKIFAASLRTVRKSQNKQVNATVI